MIGFSIQKLVDESIKEANEKDHKDYKQTSWHVSSLGSCLTGAYLSRLENEPDKEFDSRTLRIFDVGRKTEDWLINLIKENRKDLNEIRTQERVESKKFDLSGRFDLYLKYPDGEEIIEIKSKHSKAFWYMNNKQTGANENHVQQLWTYLWLTGTHRGRIVYVSKDDLCINEYPVLLDDKKIKNEVLSQLNILNRAWKEKLPPLPPDKNSWQGKYCRWHRKCVDQEKYLNDT